MVDQSTQLILLIVLLIVFISTKSITDTLGSLLDTIPMRIAAVVIVLATVRFDKLVAIGVFMVIAAIYIQHHQNELGVLSLSENKISFNQVKSSAVMDDLEQGGHADETHDEMDFTSRQEDQDNDFHPPGSSIDEKHALQTEALGSKAQSMFPDDSQNAESLMQGNSRGHHD